MSLQGSDGSDGRFSSYVEGLASVIGHADRVNPLRDYCTGLMMPCARKSVEPMAAVTAPARTAAQHQSLLHFVGQASDRARWPDRGVDHQRHRLSEEGQAFRRGGAAVLRAVGQAGQLPGGGLAVDRQSPGQPAGALSALPAAGMGGRRGAPRQGSGARGNRLQDQAGDRPRAVALGLRGGSAARRRAAGCGLWQSYQPAHADRRPWAELCRRHSVEHLGVGARHQAVAAQAMVWSGTAADPAAAQRQAQAGLGQAACVRLAQAGLAHDRLARGQCRPAFGALRPRARACVPPAAASCGAKSGS
jgi:hypothetical protein